MDIASALHGGGLYQPMDDTILQQQAQCLELLWDYNQTRPAEWDKRDVLLKQMLAEVGEGCMIEPPFRANWGGHFLHLGAHVYINFNLNLVDDTHIYIGDETMLGPNVVIATAGHPILPALRGKNPYQYNLPVHIGRNCWIGAGAVILPGITIGDNTVVGAGSVVSHDIPANVVAAGVPCRVLRPIGEQDRVYYSRGRKIDWEALGMEPVLPE